jgi:hypothetical protein
LVRTSLRTDLQSRLGVLLPAALAGEVLLLDLPAAAVVMRTARAWVEEVFQTARFRWLFRCRFLDPLQPEEVEALA